MPSLTLLTPFPPNPPHAGGTAHIFQLSRQLAHAYDLSLYTLADAPAEVRWGPMAQWCADARAFPRGRGAAPGLRPASPADPPAARQDRSPALAAFLRERWRDAPPDVVQLEFSTMAQYAPLARAAGALAVCTAHNVAFLAQLRRARQERDMLLRMRRFAGALSLWQYELRALRWCDLVLTLSEVDAAALRRWLPRLPVAYVPSGIDLGAWPPCFSPQREGEVLFVGNYAHPPNAEGALWLAREVWPLVRRACPAARLTLAGRAPSPAIQALAAADVRVPGTVDDLRPLYASASAVVAPIFWGSGVRIKLLEALACGVPVVTTALAAEGIALAHGESALFAETPEAFAAAIVRLLADPQLRAHIGAGGRAVAERDYDWAQIGRRLVGMYAALRGQGER
ncbi:glycosyltransferase [Chloroflexia bacterium SDU3-3]|nr:glycosyltransferase [Chloroflexia bacterium SDU3-3]